MKAVGFYNSLPIEQDESLLDLDIPVPTPSAFDLLVEIQAISINPADAKLRIRTATDKPHASPFVLGYDAVGVVKEMGHSVRGFRLGDRVWYAGDVKRDGFYVQLQVVDFRIAARAPTTVPAENAAALPLCALTAWELLFSRLLVPQDETDYSLLIIGGAGGVGSITTQLARSLTSANVIATASRPETKDWCLKMGAHEVVDHRELVHSVRKLGHEYVDYIVQYANTAQHWDSMCELIAPQGKIGTIVETSEKVNISALQGKSASLVWELMFTRSTYRTHDMFKQGKILARVAELVDQGVIKTTQTTVLNGLTARTLKQARGLIETAANIGKIVVKF